MAFVNEHLSPSHEALSAVSARLAAHYVILPLRREGDDTLVIAMENPEDVEILDELGLVLGCPLKAVRSEAQAIAEAIREHYGVGADTLERLVDTRDDVEVYDYDAGAVAAIDEAASDASIIKFVNQIIVDAYANPTERRISILSRMKAVSGCATVSTGFCLTLIFLNPYATSGKPLCPESRLWPI